MPPVPLNIPAQQSTRRPSPPSPAVEHDLGNTDETFDLLRAWFDEYGDVYRVYSRARRSWTWVITHPDDVKRVLVNNHRNYTKGVGIDRIRLLLGDGIMTSEGNLWRRQRRMMQPAFHRSVIERFAGVVRRENAALADDWERAARSGALINVTESISRLTLRIILQAVFSEDLERLVRGLDDNPFMVVTQESKRDPRFAYEFRQLRHHVAALARDRAASGRRHFDFLQMLIDARDADSGEPMDSKELLDEVMTLVVAGHETTASVLNWTWWLLSRHEDAETRVVEELARAGDIAGERYADLARLPYTRQVIDESMRLYPPAWLLTRRSIGPDTLGGYRLPPRTDVFISPYLLHRHPRHWARPDAFDPGNFSPELVEARHAFAYIPFSAGPRHCIGQSLALYEMMLHLHCMMRRFRLVGPVPELPAAEARINLRTAGDIHMRVERR